MGALERGVAPDRWSGERSLRRIRAVVVGAAWVAPLAALWANRRWGLTLSFDGWALAWPLLLAPALEEAVLRPLQEDAARWLRGRRETPPSHGIDGADAIAAGVATVVFVVAHAGLVVDAHPLRLVAWLAPSAVLALAWMQRRRWSDCFVLHAYFNGCLWLAGTV